MMLDLADGFRAGRSMVSRIDSETKAAGGAFYSQPVHALLRPDVPQRWGTLRSRLPFRFG